MAASILRAPFDGWSAEALLSYFQNRAHVRYFAVLDAEQATPEIVAGVLENRFCFNGESYVLPAGFAWTVNPSADIEWLILLHKFYYAVGLGERYHATRDRRYFDKWIELTSSWIDTVPLDFLTSDVMGRRVQSWIYSYYTFVSQDKAPLPASFHQKFLESLHSQVSYLCGHLTPARNHRTIELYAIFMAAVVFPEFTNAAEWLDFSRRLMLENLRADFLPDGVHCELSTDYHHLVLRNYLSIMKLARLNQVEMPVEMDLYIQRALEFAKYVHKPDGLIPALSDGDTGNFGELLLQGYALYGDEELRYVATQGVEGRSPAQRSQVFASSGYAILRSGWGERDEPFRDERYLVFDCGPLGAGNHGHLDLLSFEMAAYGRSLIVDPGRYTYHEPRPESGETNWRALFRGTGYHNTVLIDGKEQTRYEFLRKRYKISGPAPDYALKAAIHDAGFDFLHGIACSHEYPVVHERKILFAWPSYWIVTDILRPCEQAEPHPRPGRAPAPQVGEGTVKGAGRVAASHSFAEREIRNVGDHSPLPNLGRDEEGFSAPSHSYDLRFHLSDEANGKTSVVREDGFTRVDAPHLAMVHCATDPAAQGECVLMDGFVSRTYGIKHPAPVVRFVYEGRALVLHTLLYPYRTERPQITMNLLPVMRAGQPCAPVEAFALQVAIRDGEHACTDTYFSASEEDEQECCFAGQDCDKPLYFARRQETRPPEADED